jgi:hypothetical protein
LAIKNRAFSTSSAFSSPAPTLNTEHELEALRPGKK